MNFAFRVDASTQIGTGHVMRCLTLAEELRRQGHTCVFICRDHPGHLGKLISTRNFLVHLLTIGDEQEHHHEVAYENAHAKWLQVSWRTDALQTLSVLEGHAQFDWLIVDHYAIDSKWEQLLASKVHKLMVIDDLLDRPHRCDILLDQNVLDTAAETRYKELVNPSCQLLLGPHYALLAPEYGSFARSLPERDGSISRILIFVSGSDPHHLTERYLQAVSNDALHHLSVDVVIGKNHPTPAVVRQLATKRPNTRVYADLPSLAALMVRADLMLGAGGTTNWERLCLGLNSLVTSVAYNQQAINEQLASRGLIEFLQSVEDLTEEKISTELRFVLSNSNHLAEQSRTMRAAVDGLGVAKVIQLMLDQ